MLLQRCHGPREGVIPEVALSSGLLVRGDSKQHCLITLDDLLSHVAEVY